MRPVAWLCCSLSRVVQRLHGSEKGEACWMSPRDHDMKRRSCRQACANATRTLHQERITVMDRQKWSRYVMPAFRSATSRTAGEIGSRIDPFLVLATLLKHPWTCGREFSWPLSAADISSWPGSGCNQSGYAFGAILGLKKKCGLQHIVPVLALESNALKRMIIPCGS